MNILVYILTIVPTFTVQFGASALFYGSQLIPTVFNTVISTCISILIEPMSGAILTVLYYDLRIRREGFDLQLTLQQLETPASTLPTTGNV
jgi:hypothetical protein